jgi:hypothetical protein
MPSKMNMTRGVGDVSQNRWSRPLGRLFQMRLRRHGAWCIAWSSTTSMLLGKSQGAIPWEGSGITLNAEADDAPVQKPTGSRRVFPTCLEPRKVVVMLRKTSIALVVATLSTALVSTDASARAGFRGGGFHRVGVAGGGWHGAGWRGAGWHGGGARVAWRRGGWGWRGPAVAAAGVGLGLASAAAWNANAAWGSSTWGPSWGWNSGWGDSWDGGWGNSWDSGWGNSGWGGGCTRWRQVWTGWGWRTVAVNVCR